MARVRCANCGTVFDEDEGVCPGCGMGSEAVGIEEPGLRRDGRSSAPFRRAVRFGRGELRSPSSR